MKDFNHITIIGKRYFQKTYGNTYHSVNVIVDGESIGYVPFAYGYDDHYKQTAHKILQNKGFFPITNERINGMCKDLYEFGQFVMNNREKFTFVCVDVDRKKDL